MTISVRPRDIEWNGELQQEVVRIITFAVDCFGDRVLHVSVYLADLNGPRGGADKLCRITADLRGSTHVVILERANDLLAAVHRAARRLGYRIGRTIQRSRSARLSGGSRRMCPGRGRVSAETAVA